MRQPRLKVDNSTEEAVYHCFSRTVNKEHLFKDTDKEILRRQIWLVAEYCGVNILTSHVLDNHFHVLVHVPKREIPSDAELLRRYQLLYPNPTRYKTAKLAVIIAQLADNGPEAVAWRKQQLTLMGDLSQYMKLVKQRFSIWFNKTHHRVGTLWAERYGSTLIDHRGSALQVMAAYIDLNAVRAGIVSDSKDYRFGGYGEAVAGSEKARRGIMTVTGIFNWEEAQAAYRLLLFGSGAQAQENKNAIDYQDFQHVMKQGGKLSLAVVLRHRVRYFTAGAVLGSRAFVSQQLARYRKRTGRRQTGDPKPLRPVADWGDLVTMRGLRGNPIG